MSGLIQINDGTKETVLQSMGAARSYGAASVNPPKGQITSATEGALEGGGSGRLIDVEIEITEIDPTADNIAVYVHSMSVGSPPEEGRSEGYLQTIPSEIGTHEIEIPASAGLRGETIYVEVFSEFNYELGIPREFFDGAGERVIIQENLPVVVNSNPTISPIGSDVFRVGSEISFVNGDVANEDEPETVRTIIIHDPATLTEQEHPLSYQLTAEDEGKEVFARVTYYSFGGDPTIVETAHFTIAASAIGGGTRPAILLDSDFAISQEVDPIENSGAISIVFEITNIHHPARGAERLIWSGSDDVTGKTIGKGWHMAVKHPTEPHKWLWRANGPEPVYNNWNDLRGYIGEEKAFFLAYSLDDPQTIETLNATFSLESERKFYIVQSVAPPPSGDTPPVVDYSESRAVVYASALEAQRGHPGGDGMQQYNGYAQCWTKPKIIATFQDVHGGMLRFNPKPSAAWYMPAWKGLRCLLTHGGAFDPVDEKRMFVFATPDFTAQAGLGGVYMTTDGGSTATRKFFYETTDTGHQRMNGICYAPGSIGPARAERWYAFVSDKTKTGAKNGELWFSNNGGDDWSKVRTLSNGTYGTCRAASGDPTDINKAYFATKSGLFRFENAPSSGGTINKLSGKNGLPNGSVENIYISDDGQELIIGVKSKGIYKTTNRGANWTTVKSGLGNLHTLWVNRFNTQLMAYTESGKGENTIHFSTNGGSSWNLPASYEKRPGYNGRLRPSYQFVIIYWFNSSTECLISGAKVSLDVANNDYYVAPGDNDFNMKLSMRGVLGVHCSNSLTNQHYRPGSPNYFIKGFLDAYLGITIDGGKSFDRVYMPPGKPAGRSHSTACGYMIHPTRKTIAVAVDKESSGFLGIYRNWTDKVVDGDGNITTPYRVGSWTFPSGAPGGRGWHGMCYNPDEPRFAFGAKYMSSDHWVTWQTIQGGFNSKWIVVGCTWTASGGQAIFAIDRGLTGKNLYRSEDNGSSWQHVLTASHKLMATPNLAVSCFSIDPTSKRYVWTKAPAPNRLRRYDLQADNYKEFQPTPNGVDCEISRIAIDPRFPNNIWVMNGAHGSGWKIIATDDGGANWINKGYLVPDGQAKHLSICPDTGLVFTTGSWGMRYIRPLYLSVSDFKGIVEPNRVLVQGYRNNWSPA